MMWNERERGINCSFVEVVWFEEQHCLRSKLQIRSCLEIKVMLKDFQFQEERNANLFGRTM